MGVVGWCPGLLAVAAAPPGPRGSCPPPGARAGPAHEASANTAGHGQGQQPGSILARAEPAEECARGPAPRGEEGSGSGAHRSLMSLIQPPRCRRGNRGQGWQGLALGPSVRGRAGHHLCLPLCSFGGLCGCVCVNNYVLPHLGIAWKTSARGSGRQRKAGQRAPDWESGPQVPVLGLPCSACNPACHCLPLGLLLPLA